jgi:RloB-like protein
MPKNRRDRIVNTRISRPRVLILCEGEKTEPQYFQAILDEFKLTNAVIIQGASGDPTNLLKIAKSQKSKYEIIWCVFDRDSFPPDDFDNTVNACLQNAIFRGAWSNESFELWYVLHFQYLNTAPQGSAGNVRSYYVERLKAKDCLGSYKKNSKDIWEIIKHKLPDAVRNSRKLIKEHTDETPFHQRVPVTHVVDLVEALIAYANFQEVEKTSS